MGQETTVENKIKYPKRFKIDNNGKPYTERKSKIDNKDIILKIYPTIPTGESRTKTEFTDECNVNKIMATVKETGVFPEIKKNGIFGDFTNLPNYEEATETIREADIQFGNLGANVRGRFLNDPQNLIDFLKDPENKTEAIHLGLIPKPDVLPQSTVEPKKEPSAPKGSAEPKKDDPKESK